MPAGEGVGGMRLMACDRPFSIDMELEERAVRVVPANERCDVCQGVYAARERNSSDAA